MSDNAAPILSREEIGELKMFITAHRALAGTRVNDILYSHEAQREEIQCLAESRDAISALFPDDAPHKHAETGVSLLDDVRDVIAELFTAENHRVALMTMLGVQGGSIHDAVEVINRKLDEVARLTEARDAQAAEKQRNIDLLYDCRAELSALRAELEAVKRSNPPAEPSGNTGELPVCPVCFDAATYQTPDGRYWCSRAHWWLHIECDECQGMRVRVYPGTLLGQVETCRKCNGKATAAPRTDCSAVQPATEQPRIWRIQNPHGPSVITARDKRDVRRWAYRYPMWTVKYSLDNGKTWIDEQAEREGK